MAASRAAAAFLASVVLLGCAASPAAAETIALTCSGATYTLSTGTSGGDCLTDRGVRALCLDAASNAAYARCDGGCLETNGTGSCSLHDEEPVGGSFVLGCADGARYLLRTRTGRGTCTASQSPAGVRAALCLDTKDNRVEADCARGCAGSRGKAMCAKYKREDAGDNAKGQ